MVGCILMSCEVGGASWIRSQGVGSCGFIE